MRPISVLRAIAATEYFFLRRPITAVDQRLVRRLPEGAPPRRAFDRAIGNLDVLVGKLTADAALEGRGTLLTRGEVGHEVDPLATGEAARVEAEIDLARRTTAGLREAARIDAMMAVAADTAPTHD